MVEQILRDIDRLREMSSIAEVVEVLVDGFRYEDLEEEMMEKNPTGDYGPLRWAEPSIDGVFISTAELGDSPLYVVALKEG